MSQPDYHETVFSQLHSDAHILRHKLPELRCEGLLRAMYDVARSGGELTWAERDALENLRELLDIREEIATEVRRRSKKGAKRRPRKLRARPGRTRTGRRRKATTSTWTKTPLGRRASGVLHRWTSRPRDGDT